MAQELCSRTASGNILKKNRPKETVHVISCDPLFKGSHARYKTNGTTFKLKYLRYLTNYLVFN